VKATSYGAGTQIMMRTGPLPSVMRLGFLMRAGLDARPLTIRQHGAGLRHERFRGVACANEVAGA